MSCTFERVEAEKPAGGFVLVKVIQLFSLWWCYEQGQIAFADLRVWFALQEIVARRCNSQSERPARFRLDELMELTNQRRRVSVKASLERLESCGLVRCRRTSISFFDKPKEIGDEAEFERRFSLIRNRRRRVPFPRRVIRQIANKSRASLVAGIIGHVLRLLYLRGGMCRADGSCKASWIAEVFAIDVGSVKRARATLIASGLLQSQQTPQWYRNRYGWRGAVNLDWCAVDSPRELDDRQCRKLPPPMPIVRKTATAKTKPVTLFETKTPNCYAGHGVLRGHDARLGKLSAEDLQDDARVDELFERAAKHGLVHRSDRLNVFAAAERATRVGSKNPPGLFVWLLKHRKWEFVALSDQDAATSRLKRLERLRTKAGENQLINRLRVRGAVATSDISEVDETSSRQLLRIGEVLEQCFAA